MAFDLSAIVNGVTYSLSDGNPFSLESASGLAMVPVRRLSERAPRQDGDTDLGYRLEPRTITLALNIIGTSGSALDGHRDTLATIFKPSPGYDVKLLVTRDDAEVRQIDCQTMGAADVPLVAGQRPGNLNRAVVQLRAADPAWYDTTVQGTAITTLGTSGTVYLGTISYSGDYYSAPYIALPGAIVDPVITNTTTGKAIDFTGLSVAAGETLIVNLPTKQATIAGSAVAFEPDSDLAVWRLAPSPAAAGGTNVWQVVATSAGTPGTAALSYYDRYVSF